MTHQVKILGGNGHRTETFDPTDQAEVDRVAGLVFAHIKGHRAQAFDTTTKDGEQIPTSSVNTEKKVGKALSETPEVTVVPPFAGG